MKKTIKLKLNQFNCVPNSLLLQPYFASIPVSEIEIRFESLCHHMFLDTYGEPAPNPNPLYSLYSPRIMPGKELRLRGDGLGSHKEARIGEYNKFGKAFCRWFLHEHCQITYFAHMDEVLDKGLLPGVGNFQVRRVDKGDTPDYFCLSRTDLFFAEAKGTASSISFNSKKFQQWRDQFTRVSLFDCSGQSFAVKGYIIATRLVSEKDSSRVQSKLFAEDPYSAGESGFSSGRSLHLGQMVISGHYASILEKLRFPLLAVALRTAIRLARSEISISFGVWECLVPPVNNFRFVGGYYAPFDSNLLLQNLLGLPPQLNLSSGGFMFFGLEINTFRDVINIVFEGRQFANRVEEFEVENEQNELPQGMSILRDGSILAPLDYFRLLAIKNINEI